ncbi:peptidoglycan DD-metalloendopeptidase family protein [Salegentibacter sp. HM20]
MKKTGPYIFLFLSLLLLFTGCSQINKASDLITKPTAREKYQRDFEISDELFEIWEAQLELAQRDSLSPDLPYSQTGKFFPRSFEIYSYDLNLQAGERLSFSLESDTLLGPVFMELFEVGGDSIREFRKLESIKLENKPFLFEAKDASNYKLVLQPGIEASGNYRFLIEKQPVFKFPVAGMGNSAIKSFWGANRDGGARSHEGIDIFANRGTPVIAATNGRIGFTGEKGLGGKQVWLRDSKRNLSLYYAHLDSIANVSGNVKIGDTLGFVGNTGNARTTPPHLHFGIYRSYRGAINPLPFVFTYPELQPEDFISEKPQNLKINGSTANLRNKPGTTGSKIIGRLEAGDTLKYLGKSDQWIHARTRNDQAVFIHQSLASPL